MKSGVGRGREVTCEASSACKAQAACSSRCPAPFTHFGCSFVLALIFGSTRCIVRACVLACVCVCVFLQDYVAKLAKVVTGYVIPMRQRIGQLFDERSINVIFGNMEQIHQLNEKFLRELRTAAENDGVLPLKVVVVS